MGYSNVKNHNRSVKGKGNTPVRRYKRSTKGSPTQGEYLGMGKSYEESKHYSKYGTSTSYTPGFSKKRSSPNITARNLMDSISSGVDIKNILSQASTKLPSKYRTEKFYNDFRKMSPTKQKRALLKISKDSMLSFKRGGSSPAKFSVGGRRMKMDKSSMSSKISRRKSNRRPSKLRHGRAVCRCGPRQSYRRDPSAR